MMSLGPSLSDQGHVIMGDQPPKGEENRWRIGKPPAEVGFYICLLCSMFPHIHLQSTSFDDD